MSDSNEDEIVKRRRSSKLTTKSKNLKNLFDEESDCSSLEYVPEDTQQDNLFKELFGTGKEYFYIFDMHKQDEEERIIKKEEEEKIIKQDEKELISYMKSITDYKFIEDICKLYVQGYNMLYIFLYKIDNNLTFYDFLDIYQNIVNFTTKSSNIFNKEYFNIFFDRIYNGSLNIKRDDKVISITKDKSVIKGVVLDHYGNLLDKFSSVDNKIHAYINEINPRYILISGYNNIVRSLLQLLIEYKVFYMESKFYAGYSVYDRLLHVGRLGILPEVEFINLYRNIHLRSNSKDNNNSKDKYKEEDNNIKDKYKEEDNNSNDNNNFKDNNSNVDYNSVIYKEDTNSEEISNIIKIAVSTVISITKLDLDFLLQCNQKLKILEFLGLGNCTRIFEKDSYENEEEIKKILKDDNFMTFFTLSKSVKNRPTFKGFTDNFVFRELINIKTKDYLETNIVEDLINKEVEGKIFFVDEYYILVNILNNVTCYVRSTDKYYLNQIVKVKITEINEPFLSFTGEISGDIKSIQKIIKHPLLCNLNSKESENKLRNSDEYFILRQSSKDGKIIIVLKIYKDIIVHIKLDDYDNLDETVNKKVKSILRNVSNIKKHKYFYKNEDEAMSKISLHSDFIKYGFYFSEEYPGRLCFIYNSKGISKEYISISSILKYKGKEYKTLEEFIEYRKRM